MRAAQTAKRSPQFAPTYQAITRRRGKKIATTAVARKLLSRGYHLLTDTEAAPAPTNPTATKLARRADRAGNEATGTRLARPAWRRSEVGE